VSVGVRGTVGVEESIGSGGESSFIVAMESQVTHDELDDVIIEAVKLAVVQAQQSHSC
jgi:hypothetical protein